MIKFDKKECIHFFDRFAIYWHPYMKTVSAEYWNRHRRKKIATFLGLTLWVRK